MSVLLPAVGASGAWTLKTPFDTKLIPNISYSCKAIRKLSEVVATGLDAYAQYYELNGLPQSAYDQDVINDIVIITLISSEGNWLFVPSPYLDGFPSNDSVPYVPMGMAVTLGAIPNTLDPTFLTDKVVNLIKANIGLTPTIQYVTIGEKEGKPWDAHVALEQARLNLITDSNTDLQRRINAEAALATAQTHITALEQYIINAGLVPPP